MQVLGFFHAEEFSAPLHCQCLSTSSLGAPAQRGLWNPASLEWGGWELAKQLQPLKEISVHIMCMEEKNKL